jgi:hypothetical protein
VTAAYASLSNALEIFSENALVEQLRTAANETFNFMESATTAQGSYQDTFPQVASFWPSNPTELNDDKLLASACMLYSNGGEARFQCALFSHRNCSDSQLLWAIIKSQHQVLL